MAEISDKLIHAGFWRRYAAVFTDVIVSTILFILPFLVLHYSGLFDFSYLILELKGEINTGETIPHSQSGWLSILYALYLFAYYSLNSFYGATPGKRFFGIAVISANNHLRIGLFRCLFRYVAYSISAFLLFLPFLSQFFTKKRQTLYDLMLKTIVVKGKFVNNELINTDGHFTKKWLVFLLSAGFFIIGFFIILTLSMPLTLIAFGLLSPQEFMEKSEETPAIKLEQNFNEQPSEKEEQQAIQSQSYMNDGTKFTIIGTDKNSTNHFIDFESLKKIDNDTRQAIFKLNMLSIDGSSKIKQIINCNNFEIQTIEGQMFEQQDLMGESTFVQNISGNNVKAILGGSIDLKKYSAVCGSKLSTKLIPGFNLPDTALSVDSSTIYQKAAMARLWYTLSVPIGSKNIEDFKSYSFFAEVNCEISSIKTLLVNEFEGKSLNVYKASIDSPVAIKKVRASLNKRIPKTTELVDKAIVLSTCKVAN